MASQTLSSALSEAVSGYTSAHLSSLSNHSEASNYLPGGSTRSPLWTPPFPLTFTHADGITLTDVDGVKYTDFFGEATAGLFGHSNPVIKKAITDVLEDGWSFGGVSGWEARLARGICERFGMDKCRFTNSGTEANLIAISAAKVFTGKNKILVFAGAYHGSVISFPIEGPSPINVPHEFIIAPYNDINRLKSLDGMDDLAAILLEPMQGSGGCYPASTEFLKTLRDLANKAGALLIFDEVMTSRLFPGGLQKFHGVKPDITTLGKYLAGGMNFGCFGGDDMVMRIFDLGRKDGKGVSHPGTFNNNIVSMRAGCAALEVLTQDTLDRLNELGEKMRKEVNTICEKYDVQERMWVTGRGSLMAVHFGTRQLGERRDFIERKNQSLEDLFWFWMVKEGIYLARRGFVALTIVHEKGDVQRFVQATAKFLTTYKDLI